MQKQVNDPKELKAGTETDICTPTFIAALFTTAKRWKQPKYLLMDEWINKQVVYPYNGILVLNRKEILTHATTWINLEDIK